jgi:hypothetical protein
VELPTTKLGFGFECSLALREKVYLYPAVYGKNEFIVLAKIGEEKKFLICLRLAHSTVMTYRKDETKARK